MKLLSLKAMTAAAALTFAPMQAKAIVVFDPAAVAEAISNGLIMADQYIELQRTAIANTGFNQWVTDMFPEIDERSFGGSLDGVFDGGGASTISDKITGLRDEFNVLDGSALFSRDNDTIRSQLHDELSNATLSTMAMSDQAFTDAATSLANLEEYNERIGTTAGTKESIDLNTRVQIENGMLLAQLLQTMAAQTSQQAHQTNNAMRMQERLQRITSASADGEE